MSNAPSPPPLPPPLPLPAEPAPIEPLPKRPTGKLVAVLIAVGIGIAAAFNVDVCGALGAFGVHLDACAATPAPAAP